MNVFDKGAARRQLDPLAGLDAALPTTAWWFAYELCGHSPACAPLYFLGQPGANLAGFEVLVRQNVGLSLAEALADDRFYDTTPGRDALAIYTDTGAPMHEPLLAALADEQMLLTLCAGAGTRRFCPVNHQYFYDHDANEGRCECEPGRDCSPEHVLDRVGVVILGLLCLLLLGLNALLVLKLNRHSRRNFAAAMKSS